MTLYVVSEYSDQIRTKTEAALAKQNAENARWKQPPELSFPSMAEAGEFIIHRAASEVIAAERAREKARKRLLKCARKFGGSK